MREVRRHADLQAWLRQHGREPCGRWFAIHRRRWRGNTYQRTKNRELARQIIDQLVKAMNAVPRNPSNRLVHIKPGGWDRCPYGFTDSVRKQGDELFCSLLYFDAARQLADLLEAAGRRDDAQKWRADADRLADSIRSVFWDRKIGLFRAATVQCKEPDIWGSAFAVYLGVASQEQHWPLRGISSNTTTRLPIAVRFATCPGGVYWEAACPKDTYQNGGFWATPTGWFAYTLDLVDSQLADQTVLEMVPRASPEWIPGMGCRQTGWRAKLRGQRGAADCRNQQDARTSQSRRRLFAQNNPPHTTNEMKWWRDPNWDGSFIGNGLQHNPLHTILERSVRSKSKLGRYSRVLRQNAAHRLRPYSVDRNEGFIHHTSGHLPLTLLVF